MDKGWEQLDSSEGVAIRTSFLSSVESFCAVLSGKFLVRWVVVDITIDMHLFRILFLCDLIEVYILSVEIFTSYVMKSIGWLAVWMGTK